MTKTEFKWDYTHSGGRSRITRGSVENAIKAINHLPRGPHLPHGHKHLDLLERTKKTMPMLADLISKYHHFRPTLKALWKAVSAMRQRYFEAVRRVHFSTTDYGSGWVCVAEGCAEQLFGGEQLYFSESTGHFLCRDCIAYDDWAKGPYSLHQARQIMNTMGIL